MSDQRIAYTEYMIGANHPSLADTLNRLVQVEHNADGTHKQMTMGAGSSLDVASGKTVNIDDDVTVAAELHVTAATHLDEAVAMSSKAPKTTTIAGDGTAGRVIRISTVKISKGTNSNTLKIEMANVWNGDSFAAVDNIPKDDIYYGNVKQYGSSGMLTIRAAGLSGNVIAVLSAWVNHDTALTWKNFSVAASGNNLVLNFDNAWGWVDLTTIAAGNIINVGIVYITS
jgi:hypothetical protein